MSVFIFYTYELFFKGNYSPLFKYKNKRYFKTKMKNHLKQHTEGEVIMDLKNFKSMDVNILLSIVNMKLRDEFENLEELVKFYDISEEELKKKLDALGYHYCSETNQFNAV